MRALTLLLGARSFETAGLTFKMPRFGRWMAVMAERRRLAGLDDARLDDVGLTRDQANAEAARPFWDTLR